MQLDHVAEELFPLVRLKQQRLRDHMSRATTLFKTYLAQKQFEATEHVEELMLLRQLRKRGLNDTHQQHCQLLKQKLEQSPNSNGRNFRNLFFLAAEEEAYFRMSGERKGSENIAFMDKYLDLCFVSRKLSNLCEMANRETILTVKYQRHFEEIIPQLLDNHNYNYLLVPDIRVQKAILDMLNDPEEPMHYREVLKLCELHQEKFTTAQLSRFYEHAQNYCIRQINKGVSSYFEEIFRLYKKMLKLEAFGYKEMMSHAHYKNIVTTGLRLKEFAWVKKFLEEYKDSLPGDIRYSAYTQNLASYYYETGQHEKVKELLVKVEFADVYYAMGAKYLLIKVFYEGDELIPLHYQLASFERFLKRKKALSVERRKQDLKFVKIVQRMLKIKEYRYFKSAEYIDKQKKELKEMLESEIPPVNLSWLKKQFALL